MSKIFSACLYFLSFTPLWISVLFVNGKSIFTSSTNLCTEYISTGVIICGFTVATLCLISNLKQKNADKMQEYTLETLVKEKAITAEFLLSYILPLFAFDFTVWDEVVLFLVFYIILGYLCIKHNYFSVNIILEFAKYNTYQCQVINSADTKLSLKILSRNELRILKGSEVKVRALNNDFYLYMNNNTSI